MKANFHGEDKREVTASKAGANRQCNPPNVLSTIASSILVDLNFRRITEDGPGRTAQHHEFLNSDP